LLAQLRIALLLPPLAAVLCAATAARGQTADRVELRFAWPDGISLRVERSFERIDVHPDGREPAHATSTARYSWQGRRSDDRTFVAFGDFEVVRDDQRPSSTDPMVQLESAARSLDALLPTLVVDGGGQIVAFEGIPELRERLRARYEGIPGIGANPEARKAVDVLLSDAVLTQRAAEDWNRMVEVWHGVDASVPQVRTASGFTGAAGGTPVRNDFVYAVERRVSCGPEPRDRACVHLTVTQRPVFSDARTAADVLLGPGFMETLGAPARARLEFESVFATDAHPGTLVPVRYVKEKRWSVAWVDDGGRPRSVGRTDRWTYEFSPLR
jgi:hypothetical protein